MKSRHIILLGIAVQALACNEPTPLACNEPIALACNEPITPSVASAITPVGVLALAGFVAEPLGDSLRVRVTDQRGAPMAGVTVTWWASDGSISSAQVETDADGRAATAWHLGKSAKQQVMATVAALSPVTFTAQATARRYELVTSFQTFTYYVGYCPGGYGYCSHTAPAGDARLVGTLRRTVGDTATLERHLHPLDGSRRGPLTYRVGQNYLVWGAGEEYVHLQNLEKSGDDIVGDIRWETKTGPTGRSYTGTFVLRRL